MLIVEQLYAKKKIISAVCHGPAALVLVKDPETGKSILDGKKVTGFSNAEEETTPYADYDNILGFSLEDKLKSLSGGHYEGASPNYSEKVFADGLVFTGRSSSSCVTSIATDHDQAPTLPRPSRSRRRSSRPCLLRFRRVRDIVQPEAARKKQMQYDY